MTELKFESSLEVLSLDFYGLYQSVKVLRTTGNNEIRKRAFKVLEKVENGVNLRFPVEIIINGDFHDFPIVKRVRVDGFGQINRFRFMREIEDRRQLMVELILDSMQPVERVSPYSTDEILEEVRE